MTQFARAPDKYNQSEQIDFRDAVRQAVEECQPRRQSIELVANAFVYMRSPKGSRWQISVSNAGAIVVTAA